MINLKGFYLDDYKNMYSNIKEEFKSGKSKSKFIHEIPERLELSKNSNGKKIVMVYLKKLISF